MSYYFMGLLFQSNEVISVHGFKIPAFLEENFYRQTVSYNSFRSRENRKLFIDKECKIPRHYYGKRLGICDIEDYNEWNLWRFNHFKALNLPYFEHDSLWELYKGIGYDYKKQKYLSEIEK